MKRIYIIFILLSFLILTFSYDTTEISITKYHPVLRYSLVSPWFELSPSNSKTGIISTAMDQLGLKKYIFKTLYNLHTKNLNLDYKFANRKNRSTFEYVRLWLNEEKEQFFNTSYYPKYSGFEVITSRSLGWNKFFSAGLNYEKTDKSEGLLDLYKGERYNLVLRLSNSDHSYSTDYPLIIRNIDFQSLSFIKDIKQDGLSEIRYTQIKSLYDDEGFQIKGSFSYDNLSDIPVYDPLILLRPKGINHIRGFKKEVYAQKMLKGSLDIKKRLYRDLSFKLGHSYSLSLYCGLFFDHLDATLGVASRSYSTYGISLEVSSLLLGKIPYSFSFYILKDDDRNTEQFSYINISLLRF